MYISAREREIIHLLLENSSGINIQEIAEKIQVSSRTVHREMKGIEQLVEAHNLTLKKVTGVGMFIEGEPEQINELKIALLKSGQEFTPKERQELILCALLKEADSIKLASLAHDLNVTVATISNDLNKVEEWLQKFDLELLRKKGYGIVLQGSEKKKRSALGSLITEQLNEYEFLTAVESEKEDDNNETSRKLLEIIKLEQLTVIGKLIRDIEQRFSYSLADNAYMTFTIHLSLAIERIIQGEMIIMESEVLKELQESNEYTIAKQIAKELEEVFLVKIPESEVGYITMHLQGARMRRNKNDWLERSDAEIVAGSKKLIHYVSQKMEIPFEKDRTLFEGLITHIEPAIYRLQKNLASHNPLAAQIKKDYPLLFGAIEEGLVEAFPSIAFTREEVAYLVLHFGSSQEIYDGSREVTALVLCSSGIGSSKMLASRIQKEIKEITDIDVSSLANLRNIQLDKYDIILSTVDMPGFSKKYVVVNPLLTKGEIENIRKEIQHNKRTTEEMLLRRFQKKKALEAPEAIKAKVEDIHLYSGTILHIMNTFEVLNLNFMPTTSTLLVEACKQLNARGLIGDYFEVANQLLEREKLGGLGIPDTTMALYHCRSQYVSEPVFVSFQLSEAMTMKAMDQSSLQVGTLLILLAPIDLEKSQLEVLSIISATIVEDEQTMKIFASNNYDAIYQKLSNVFHENLQKKLQN